MAMQPTSLVVVIFAVLFIPNGIHAQFCRQRYYGTICENMEVNPNETLKFDGEIRYDGVTTIKFDDCELPQLTWTILSNLRMLRSLQINKSNLTEIKPGTFQDHLQLTKIDLSHNQLTEITNETFIGAKHLGTLTLNYNNISSLSEDAFDDVNELENFYIRENSLHQVVLVKHNLQSVRYLDLAHNHLTKVVLRDLPKVQTLKLHNNNLTTLDPENFVELGSMTNFYTAYNEIQLLADDLFRYTPKLVEMDLSHNILQSFSEKVFVNLTSIRNLYLNHNRITYIKANSFKNCRSMTLLRFWSNHIFYIEEGAFNGLEKLKKLELENNRLTIIANKLFVGAPQLENLQLNGNNIREMSVRNVLINNRQIKEITIANNKWDCKELLTMVEELRYSRVSYDGGNSYGDSNVEGIACGDYDSDEIETSNNNGAGSQVLKKFVQNDFPKSNFYKYFDNDYKQSSLYKLFNEKYADSDFANYLRDDFKNSNFLKFFNKNFADSGFFKYLNEEFKDNLSKRLAVNQITGDAMNSEKLEGETLQLVELENSRNNFETFTVIFVSVGVVLFVVIMVFMVVLYRTVRDLSF